MRLVPLPVLKIFPGQLFRSNNQHIFSIALFSSPSEIKTPGDHHFPVNNHDFIVGNTMNWINILLRAKNKFLMENLTVGAGFSLRKPRLAETF